MKDIPIIFSGPMVRALLDGRKTMTRRLAWRSETDVKKMDFICDGEKPNPLSRLAKHMPVQMAGAYWLRPSPWLSVKPGDRLWVRETWAVDAPDLETARAAHEDMMQGGNSYGPYYLVGEVSPDTLKWRSPIHTPRWASRLTLIITATKIQRLRLIGEDDVRDEGVIGSGPWWVEGLKAATYTTYSAKEAFKNLWTRLHGTDAWKADPEVVALRFRVVKANIDAAEARAA